MARVVQRRATVSNGSLQHEVPLTVSRTSAGERHRTATVALLESLARESRACGRVFHPTRTGALLPSLSL